MSKLSMLAPQPTPIKAVIQPIFAKSVIKTRSMRPDTTTYEGGEGYTRKTKSELFLLAVSNMVGEDTVYEGATERDKRFVDLVHKVTKKDPEWVARFIPYLRNEMNMRSASIVAAVEYVVAGGPSGRSAISSALSRADEPAEVIGYYRAKHGRNLPQPIKRGVADAIRRMVDEKAALKYGSGDGYRLADVIELTHPEPKASWQSKLFEFLIRQRHNRPEYAWGQFAEDGLNTIANYKRLMAVPAGERRSLLDEAGFPKTLADAGLTWEALSGWLQGPMDAKAWEAIIPSMGYMALLRNLRNFEQAGVDKATMLTVYEKLTDPEQVKRSRQFPIRFYSAFKNVENLSSKAALEDALQATLQNVPALSGRTLILVDNSFSMGGTFSNKGTTTYRETAGLFGAALALRAENADLYAYDDREYNVEYTKSTPVLELAKRATVHNGATNTIGVLMKTYSDHDRVVILTDEQTWASGSFAGWRYGGVEKEVEKINAPIYTFNLAGYKQGHLPSGKNNRYTFGGLTDAGFRLIDLLERGENENWPF